LCNLYESSSSLSIRAVLLVFFLQLICFAIDKLVLLTDPYNFTIIVRVLSILLLRPPLLALGVCDQRSHKWYLSPAGQIADSYGTNIKPPPQLDTPPS
jgi:hypothetical protein